MLTNFWKY